MIRRRSRRVVEEKKEPQAKKEVAAKEGKEALPTRVPNGEEAAKPGLVLDGSQKQEAVSLVSKNLKLKEDKKPVEKIIKPKNQEPEKKPEKPKVLKFKDRIKGTIDLSKFKEEGDERPKRRARPEGLLGEVPDHEDVVFKKEKAEKAKRARRSVKQIGGDLDIDGRGRAVNLAQLVRTATADRVFRPGSVGGGRGMRKKKIISKKNLKQTTITTKKAAKRFVEVDKSITVGRLAQELGVKAGDIIKQLMDLGVMATINQEIDKDTAAVIAAEHKYEIRDISFKEEAILKPTEGTEGEGQLKPRPPVVTVMGHVDHGKTSLLDAIRSTNVISTEAGGITQHIGAYTVSLPQGKITFLDTPGHEAFTTMRSRGAQVTDIVVLVVAADDGVMPQTVESINHAKAAGVPIIVAVNKIDKDGADPEKVKRQLSEKQLVPEDWGGDTIFNEVSALKKTGIKELLESILLQAEIMELKTSADGAARGVVLEGKLDRNRGPVCTLLVQSGTLRQGDPLVAGTFAGKIRAMYDWRREVLEAAGPSSAVEVLGMEGVPEAGDPFHCVPSEQDAQKIVQFRQSEQRREAKTARGAMTLEAMFARMKSGEVRELNIILKTDVQGSLEAVRDAIKKVGNEEVKANIIHAAVGGVNESDVRLAMASQAVIIGFNVRPETSAIHLAKEQGVDIKLYKVIYDLVNEVKLALEGLLEPEIKEAYLGRAEVRQTFAVSKLGIVAGCMVVDGRITRNAELRLLRDNVVIHEGRIHSLKRFKDDAKEVKQGFECGVGIEGYQDIKEGDVIEAFESVKVKKTL